MTEIVYAGERTYVDGVAYYGHSYVNSIACNRDHRGRGNLFAAVRHARIPDPCSHDGNTCLWRCDAVDEAEKLYEYGPDGFNGFGLDRDGYGRDGRHPDYGFTREELKEYWDARNQALGAYLKQQEEKRRRDAAAKDAAVLQRVDNELRMQGARLSSGDSGWMAESLGGGDVIIARVPRGGTCRRCNRTGTQQGMPNLVWDRGEWQDNSQCGSCGSIGGVDAPYRVVEDATPEKIAEAIRDLAGKRTA